MSHPVTLRVAAGEMTLFAIEGDGGMTVPASASDRLFVVSTLAQALVNLASAPLDEDGEPAEPRPEAVQ
ncbi:hypothetical protein ACQVP2_28305 [Methylobacterium aquaticum]|uniref:hypothetical protein n=1 Tax=Methylobacterium aquaticum TaxID=270351 RepID=UPI003D183BB8